MNTVRNNITRIKNSILPKLPDGEDIFGFKGINKKAIEDLLSDSYNYSYQLNELEPKVEIVLLKRKLAAILDPLREKIDSIDFAKDDGDGFNDILNGIVAIRDAIRSTYIYVVDKGLRTEVYAIDLKTKVDGTEKNVNQLMKLAETVEQSLAGFQAVSQSMDEQQKKYASAFEVVQSSITQLSTQKNNAEASYTLISKLEGESKTLSEKGKTATALIEENAGKSVNLIKQLDGTKNELQGGIDTLKEHQTISKQLQDEIKSTLEAANRVGMANSFKQRKDELRTSLLIWGLVFISFVTTIFVTGLVWIKPDFVSESGAFKEGINYIQVFVKFLFVSPLIWIGWVSAKQYGFISQIREDYAYKFATAMAFEGYKKQAKDIDEIFEKQLIAISIIHLSENPIRLYSSRNDASPLSEILREAGANFFKFFGKQKSSESIAKPDQ